MIVRECMYVCVYVYIALRYLGSAASYLFMCRVFFSVVISIYLWSMECVCVCIVVQFHLHGPLLLPSPCASYNLSVLYAVQSMCIP